MKKNNKMVLALVVVAALAMVSIAGIALSDDSAAAKISNNILIQPGETSAVDYDFYVIEDNLSTPISFVFKVGEGGSYTGTVQLGTLTADEKTYTSYGALKMAGAGAVLITATMEKTDSGIIAFFTISNLNKDFGGATPAGTYELTKGQIKLGYYDGTNGASFCGKIKVGGFTATANYVAGTILALDSKGKARISGVAASPVEILPSTNVSSDDFNVLDSGKYYPKYDSRTLVLEGEATIQFPESYQKLLDDNMGAIVADLLPPAVLVGVLEHFMDAPLAPLVPPILPLAGINPGTSFDIFATDSVYVTVEAGAVISAGGSERPATVSETITIETEAATAFSEAFLVSSDGKVYSASIVAGLITFEYVPFGTYTFVAYDGTQMWYSTGARVSATSFTLGSALKTSAAAATPTIGLYDDGTTPPYNVWGFLSSTYSVDFALDVTNDKVLTTKVIKVDIGGSDVNLIVLMDGNTIVPVGGTVDVVVIGSERILGNPQRYFQGTVDDPVIPTTITTVVKAKTGSAALAVDEIRAKDSDSAGAIAAYIVLDDQKMLVKGEMNFIYSSSTVYGMMAIDSRDPYVTFEGEGIISHGVTPVVTYSDVPAFPLEMASENMVAAYYYVNAPATGTVTNSTYYFTSLANAIKKSNEITLMGKHVILVDTTLDNSEFSSITIYIGTDASLEVGRLDDPATTEDESANPKLTVPAKTKIIVTAGADHYSVVSGQAIYDVKPAASDEPEADILIEGAKYIYTDLATALDISVSGDELNLRQPATLNRDATLKAGVKLDDKGYAITIPEDVTMTVNGDFKSTGNMAINGTIRINGKANFTGGGTATFGPNGAIDIMSAGVLTVDTSTIVGTVNNGAITVSGELVAKNGATISAKVISVSGKVSVTSSTVTALKELWIGVKPVLSPLSEAYTNTAVINGAITLDPAAAAYVYGNFTVGTKIIPAGFVKTEYFIEDNLYITLYAAASPGVLLPMLYEDQLKDIKIKEWSTDKYGRNEATTFLSLNPTKVIGEAGWEKLYCGLGWGYEWVKYKITCETYLGVTWTVNGQTYVGPYVEIEYGKTVAAKALVQPGYEGTPVITANGGAYTAGTAMKVTSDVNFALKDGSVVLASDKKDDDGGLTLIEILLIIIVIIIAVIAIIIAIRLLRS
ncbi:MAG: polymer-forming cytoskeletal protein [Methanomassiliicoccaceae archaeon]|nr:polymer-forming cytoskeletal protein [Methanomassiliicoccaceae archaeon]